MCIWSSLASRSNLFFLEFLPSHEGNKVCPQSLPRKWIPGATVEKIACHYKEMNSNEKVVSLSRWYANLNRKKSPRLITSYYIIHEVSFGNAVSCFRHHLQFFLNAVTSFVQSHKLNISGGIYIHTYCFLQCRGRLLGSFLAQTEALSCSLGKTNWSCRR